jgi:hypothetical protein
VLVRIVLPTQQAEQEGRMARRYSEAQLGHVLQDANAKDWSDVLAYLEARPDRTALDHDQLAELEDDLEKLKDRGAPFRADAAAAYGAIEAIQPSRVVPGRTGSGTT